VFIQITSTWDSDDDNDDEPNHLDDEDNHDVESPFVPYCQQVSVAEFEQQRLMGSQEALSSLLEDLIKNKNISQRDKKRHLKQVCTIIAGMVGFSDLKMCVCVCVCVLTI